MMIAKMKYYKEKTMPNNNLETCFLIMHLLTLECDLEIQYLFSKMIPDGDSQMTQKKRKNFKNIQKNYFIKKKTKKKKKLKFKCRIYKVFFYKSKEYQQKQHGNKFVK